VDSTVPSTLQALFLSFGPVFTVPSFGNFARLVTGWMLCRGRHTVSAVIRAGGAGGKHFSTLYRFFSRAEWDPDELGRALFEMLVAFVTGAIHIIVDDTLFRRSGPHFWGAGMHHDPLKSTYGGGGGRHLALAFGHNRVTLALWVPLPWGLERGIAVPFLWRTYRSKKRCPEKEYLTRPQLAAGLLEVFTGWDLGGRKITLVGDGEYACKTVVRRLPSNVEFIGPVVMKAAIYDRPHRQRRMGRTRLRGARLPSPEKLAASSQRWKTVFPTIYGRKVPVKVKSQVGMWYTVAHTRMVRIVVTRDPKGRIEDRAYFTTDLSLSVEELLAGYSRRWTLEVAFRDAKQHLGLEDPQNGWWRRHRPKRRRRKKPGPQPRGNRGRKAVEHTVPLAFCAYGLVVAWYLRHGTPERDVQRARESSPWYRHKTNPSFADMFNAVRREICQAGILAHPSLNPVRQIVQRLLLPAWSIPA
jgi:hypothetical protein